MENIKEIEWTLLKRVKGRPRIIFPTIALSFFYSLLFSPCAFSFLFIMLDNQFFLWEYTIKKTFFFELLLHLNFFAFVRFFSSIWLLFFYTGRIFRFRLLSFASSAFLNVLSFFLFFLKIMVALKLWALQK